MQQPGGPAGGPFHPRNNFQAPNSGGPMSNNPGIKQILLGLMTFIKSKVIFL